MLTEPAPAIGQHVFTARPCILCRRVQLIPGQRSRQHLVYWTKFGGVCEPCLLGEAAEDRVVYCLEQTGRHRLEVTMSGLARNEGHCLSCGGWLTLRRWPLEACPAA